MTFFTEEEKFNPKVEEMILIGLNVNEEKRVSLGYLIN
jgi:hypothetical protein